MLIKVFPSKGNRVYCYRAGKTVTRQRTVKERREGGRKERKKDEMVPLKDWKLNMLLLEQNNVL